MKAFAISIFLLISGGSYSQQTKNPPAPKETKTTAIKGTYQLIFESNEIEPVSIDSELMNFIERNRQSYNNTYLLYKPGVLVHILATETIQNANFIPLKETEIVDSKIFNAHLK